MKRSRDRRRHQGEGDGEVPASASAPAPASGRRAFWGGPGEELPLLQVPRLGGVEKKAKGGSTSADTSRGDYENELWPRVVAFAALAVVTLLGMCAMTMRSLSHSDLPVDPTFATIDLASTLPRKSPASLSLRTYNDYTREVPIRWSPWEHLAEPHKPSTLEVQGSESCEESEATARISWHITSPEGDIVDLEGCSVTHTFVSVGQHVVELKQEGSAGVQEEIMVKYVRREMRSLTDDDRERFLSAMETLWHVSQSEGELQYGSAYRSIDHFVTMHLEGAGSPECDHWHDDAGIMTHHVGFTLEFEQALQAVDASVSVPYWEYTVDTWLYGDDISQSPIFYNDWFGPILSSNPEHVVDRGRWAFTSILGGQESAPHNPYGLLRSPWNANPTPFLTRHTTVNGKQGFFAPTCETFAACARESSLAGINNCLNGAAHGPIHILVGGEWNHPDESFVQSWGFHGKLVLIMKSLWRRGYLRLPSKCTAGEEDSCLASCPEAIYRANGMTSYDVLLDSGALEWIAPGTKGELYFDDSTGKYRVMGVSAEAEMAYFDRLLADLCNPGHVGEMFTSSAPYDPVFWIIHPTAERLLGMRRLSAEQEKASPAAPSTKWDESWGYLHRGDVGDTGVVCDWSGVPMTDDWIQLPECRAATCSGHNEQDLLPFSLLMHGETVHMTNKELYDLIHPYNEDLPYMYDTYEWKHCVEQGVNLPQVLLSS